MPIWTPDLLDTIWHTSFYITSYKIYRSTLMIRFNQWTPKLVHPEISYDSWNRPAVGKNNHFIFSEYVEIVRSKICWRHHDKKQKVSLQNKIKCVFHLTRGSGPTFTTSSVFVFEPSGWTLHNWLRQSLLFLSACFIFLMPLSSCFCILWCLALRSRQVPMKTWTKPYVWSSS